MWSELDRPWQVSLELAWEAYRDDCIPIGAVVTDSGGNVLARGRNRVYPRSLMGDRSRGVEIAHAEVEAMQNLEYSGLDPHTCALYTTTEPCPMCIGTFYMSGLRRLNFAARDPWAGSVNLLGKTWYLSQKKITLSGPQARIEPILVALFVEQELRFHDGQLPQDQFWKVVAETIPRGGNLGFHMYQQLVLNRLRARGESAANAFEEMAILDQNLYKTG